MSHGEISPGKRRNDSLGHKEASLPLSPLLRRMAASIEHEHVVKPEAKKIGANSNQRLSDEQIIQLRREFDSGIHCSRLVALHKDWPLPRDAKIAENVVRHIVEWVNRRWRKDGSQFEGGPAPKNGSRRYGRS